jgi:CBS domain-containing protein
MQPRVVVVRRDEPLASAMAALHTNRARYAAVMNGHEIEGVLAERDLDALPWMIRSTPRAGAATGGVAASPTPAMKESVGRRPAPLHSPSDAWMTELVVEDVMRTPPLVLGPDASLAQAGRLLRDGARDCVVVVSEGRPVGVVTRDELMGGGPASGPSPPVGPGRAARRQP